MFLTLQISLFARVYLDNFILTGQFHILTHTFAFNYLKFHRQLLDSKKSNFFIEFADNLERQVAL